MGGSPGLNPAVSKAKQEQSKNTAKTKPPAEVVRGERVRGLRVVGPAVVAMEDILMISSEPT